MVKFETTERATHLVWVLRVHEDLLVLLEPRVNFVEANLEPAFQVTVLEELRRASRSTVVYNNVVRVRLGVATGVLEVDLVNVVDRDVV